MTDLKDWLNSINTTKINLIDEDPDIEKNLLHVGGLIMIRPCHFYVIYNCLQSTNVDLHHTHSYCQL